MNHRAWVFCLCLVGIAALVLRTTAPDARPMHNDEAVNAIRLGDSWSGKNHRYDPEEHHGPSLYYISAAVARLAGVRSSGDLGESILRLTPALCGVAAVLLLGLLRDGLGRAATMAAAILTAISPAMVFHSRNYIHEMSLACFTLLALAGAWRYFRSGNPRWAVVAGLGLGLMHATKETFVLCLAAAAAAVVLTVLMSGGTPALRRLPGSIKPAHLALAAMAALVVSCLLFTSFFTNWSGPLDSVRTYLPWLKRAAGESPHIHPWYFYLERLLWFRRPGGTLWTEGIILLLGLAGCVAALRDRLPGTVDVRLARFLAIYTLSLTAIYSLIAYKTPWCLLGFLHGWILLAGIGTASVFSVCRTPVAKTAAAIPLLAATAHLAWQSWQLNFICPADSRSPLVYAQTAPDFLRLPDQIDRLLSVHPDGENMRVKVIAPAGDYWPLPYYLRRMTRVGWFDELPDDPYAPVIVAAAQLHARLDERSEKKWLMVGLFEQRPGVFMELYVEANLWKKWIASRSAVGAG